MKLSKPWMRSGLLVLAALAPLTAQFNPNLLSAVLNVMPPEKVVAKRGQNVTADLRVDVRAGYHVNGEHLPDPYLIPIKLTWTAGSAQVTDVVLPKANPKKFPFSEQPIPVYEGEFKIPVKIKVAPNAPLGPVKMTGKLRYQACNDKMCLPPRTLDIAVPLEIQN